MNYDVPIQKDQGQSEIPKEKKGVHTKSNTCNSDSDSLAVSQSPLGHQNRTIKFHSNIIFVN